MSANIAQFREIIAPLILFYLLVIAAYVTSTLATRNKL